MEINKMEINEMEKKNNIEGNILESNVRKVFEHLTYIFAFALFVLVISVTIYYVAAGQKAELHSDCTDTIMWANASYESGHIYDKDFAYACFLPFGVNLIMQPFITKFGFSLTTHIIGMMGFFILLILFFCLMLREMHWDIRYICIAGSIFFSMTLVSAKVRELFWGHTIYYTLGLLFLITGMYLYGHLLNIGSMRKQYLADGKSPRICSIKYYLTLFLLCLFIMFTATDGISSLTIFALPFIGAISAEVFFNSKTSMYSRKMIVAGLRAILFLTMVFLGLKLNSRWLDGMTAVYQDSNSVYSAMDTWVEHLLNLPTAWLRLLGVIDMDGLFLSGKNGMLNIIYIFNALIISVIPIIATVFYTKYDNEIKGRMIRNWIWIHWTVTAFVLLGYICGVLSTADWRLLPVVGTSLILSIIFIMWAIEKNIGVSRLAAVFAVPLITVSFMSCIKTMQIPRDGYKDNYLFQLAEFLEDEDLSYGYATFWNANAITLISGNKIKVRDVVINDSGVERHVYQSLPDWYENQPGQKDYFLLLQPDEYDAVKKVAKELISDYTRKRKVKINGVKYHVLVFDHNIIEG